MKGEWITPTFDYYRDILVPIRTKLVGDPRFGGRQVNVFYDRSDERQVELDLMPCVQYFLLSPWDDTSIGVGQFSVQSRKFTLRVGMVVWVFGEDGEQIDLAISQLGGDLADFIRENEYWDQTRQIVIQQSVPFDIDYPITADGHMIGAVMFGVTFDQMAG